MLRCVAVLLCLVTSQGLRVSPWGAPPVLPRKEKEVAKLSQIDYTELRVALSEQLLEPEEDVVPTPELTKDEQKVDPKDDDFAKEAKSLKMDKKVLKEGDGKTFVAKGDTVKIRMAGAMKAKHFHDQQFEGIFEYDYPMPKFAGAGGQKSPVELVKDTDILPSLSLGGLVQISLKDTKTGDVKNTVEMELLEVRKAGSASEAKPEITFAKDAATTKVLKAQKASGMTMRRKVLKEGDGKTMVQKGDIITMRQTGTVKEKGKKMFMNTTSTYEYPMLMEPFTMKVKGYPIKVKFAWDEKVAPDMTEGEIQEVSFDPIQIQMGLVKGPKYKFPAFNMELVKVQKAK